MTGNPHLIDGRLADFTPRFDSLDRDNERYLFRIVDLADEGKIPHPKGTSLYGLYAEAGYDWIAEQYWERGLHAEIEAYHTHSGEVAFGPMYEGTAAAIARLVAVGETPRARRIWRNYLGHMKKIFWTYADEKRRGFRIMKNWIAPEAEQRAAHDRLVAKVPGMKADLLRFLAEHRAWLVETGAPEAELACADRDIADVEAERRTPPPGKPDPRKMDDALFWEILDTGLGTDPVGERIDALPDRLAGFKPTAIRAFAERLDAMDAAAYRTDIWALAYLLRGGCSDDAFDGFRAWLMLQGRAVWEATLADPDSFDTARFGNDSDGCQSMLDSAEIAYELRTGKPMKPIRRARRHLEGPEVDEDAFPRLLPRIARAVDWED